MLIYLLSFHLINSFLVIQSFSVEKKCSTNNDCDYELICNRERNICTCPKSYFWHDDIHLCLSCAPGWIELNLKQCLLFAITQSSGVTWYQAKITCNRLLARPLMINNLEEFQILNDKINSLSNRMNVLTKIIYFYQGIWIEINNNNNELMKSYIWCENNKKRDVFDCIQLRKNNITNTFCLQYVSCNEQANFICEASRVLQSILKKNLAEAKHSRMNDRNDKTRMKRFRRALTTLAHTSHPAPGQHIIVTTKKPSSFSFDSLANIINGAFTAVGHVSNAIGSYYGSKQQNQQSNTVDTSYYNQMPQALTDNDSNNSNKHLVYGGIAVVVILFLLIIIIIIFCFKKKKQTINSQSSIRSSESYTSVVSTE